MSVEVGLLASRAAVELLSADPPLTSVTNFYAEMEDPFSTEGNSANVRDVPCVVCFFEDATEYPPFTGNYSGNLVFRVIVSADDNTADEAEQIFSDCFSRIAIDTIVNDLSSAIGGFSVFGLTSGMHQGAQAVSGRFRTKTLTVPLNACAKDL